MSMSFEDLEYTTIDFALFDPRDTRIGSVVARVTVSASCIIELKERIERL